MYERILVPLDGKPPAEAVLPHVAELARAFDAEVTLLHIEPPTYRPTEQPRRSPGAPPPPGAPGVVPEQSVSTTVLRYAYDQSRVARTTEYVEGVAEQLRSQGIRVKVVVETDPDVADRIAEIAREGSVDLIALTTHPTVGIARFLLGSTLDRVVRSTSIPVLIIRVTNATG